MMLLAFVGSASAAKTATIVITGTIAATLSVTITPASIAGNLLFDNPAITTNLVVGTAEFSTNMNSWNLGVYSLNGSKLMGPSGEFLSYKFSLGDIVGMQDLTLGTSIAPITKVMTGKNPRLVKDLKITYTGNPLAQSGVYTDTINFTVGDN